MWSSQIASSTLDSDSRHPPILWWRENLNFILTTLLILFLFRCYCFDFFQIPSQSMHPTLHGHPHFGDRIFVNRAIYEFDFFKSQIQRWDVIVFKYPLNTARYFVKRVVGLPQETLQILSSNIVINQKIAQKPSTLQERLFFENGRSSTQPFFEFFQQQFDYSPKNHFQIDLPSNGIFVSTEETATAEYIPVNEYQYDEDTRIELQFLPLKNTGFIELTLGQGEDRFSWRFGAKQSSFLHQQTGQTPVVQPLALQFKAHQRYRLKFQVLDGVVQAELDGQLVFPLYEPTFSSQKSGGRLFQLDFFETECKLLDIRLFYDIRYIQELNAPVSWNLGKKEYFVCGDYAIESDDSRKWRKIKIQVKSETHTSFYEGDAEQKERMWKEKEVLFVDIFGKIHSFPRNAVHVSEIVPVSAVPKKYILGKALWIFWPFERIGRIH